MPRQLAMRKNARPRPVPDIALLDEVVAPEILRAMRTASETLSRAGIRHALVGGLAVGAHGHPRATTDVDFLVGEEAFIHHQGGVVTVAPGVPVQVGNVTVDPISIRPGDEHLEAAVSAPIVSHGVPVAPAEALVFTKLRSPRRKDAADVVELVKSGLDVEPVRRYLTRHSPDLLPKFEALFSDAQAEDE